MNTIHRTLNPLSVALVVMLILAACSPASTPALPNPQIEPDTLPTLTSTTDEAVSGQDDLPQVETTEPLETDAADLQLSSFCQPPVELTPPMTEGPFYTPNTPLKTSLLEVGMPGTRVLLSGFVIDRDCSPISGAYLDFWQADAEGVYDNNGYRLRGHQFSDENGRYALETILPGEYPGRTPHIHFKAQAPGGAMLTSQLFFPNTDANARDRIFDPRLVVDLQETPQGLQAFFVIVLQAE